MRFRLFLNGSLCDVGLMNDQNRVATALKKQLTINSYAKTEFFSQNKFSIWTNSRRR